MRTNCFSLRPVLLAGLLSTAAMPALAFEADEVGERLQALFAGQGVVLSYESAERVGDDVTLSGVTVTYEEVDETIPLGDLTLQDVSEADDGELRVGTIAMDTFEHREPHFTLSWTGVEIAGLVLPEEPPVDPLGVMMRYDRVAVERIEVETERGLVASADNIQAAMTVAEDGALVTEGGADAFTVDLAAFAEDTEASRVLEAMGYSQITGSVRTDGLYRASDGRLSMSRNELTVEDAGTLGFTLDLAGLTPAFMQTLEEMRQALGADGSAQGMAMLGMLQQLTYHGLTLRFDDDTFTEKALQQIAERQDTTPEDLVTMAEAGIQQQLSAFLGEDFAAEVAQAVGTFLRDPDNIEARAVPENGVPFAMLMGAAMGSPELLVRQIGLVVRANQ